MEQNISFWLRQAPAALPFRGKKGDDGREGGKGREKAANNIRNKTTFYSFVQEEGEENTPGARGGLAVFCRR